MMVRFLLACAVAAAVAAGAAQARQASTPAAATDTAPAPAPAPAPAAAPVPSVPEAAGTPAPIPSAVRQPGAAGPAAGSLIQTILALSAVLALLALLAWIMKRYGPKAAAGSAHVKLVGSLNLGGRERIMVVEVGDQWIVVGASPGRINALAAMPRKEAVVDEAPAQASLHPHQPSASSFAEWLKQTIDKRNAK